MENDQLLSDKSKFALHWATSHHPIFDYFNILENCIGNFYYQFVVSYNQHLFSKHNLLKLFLLIIF